MVWLVLCLWVLCSTGALTGSQNFEDASYPESAHQSPQESASLRDGEYKKQENVAGNTLDDIENSMGYTAPYSQNRREKKDKPESKLYLDEADQYQYHLFPFPYPYTSLHRSHARPLTLLAGSARRNAVPHLLPAERPTGTPGADATISQDNYEEMYQYCWEIMANSLTTCVDMFKDKRTPAADKCIRARPADELLLCGEFLRAYKPGRDIDSLIVEERTTEIMNDVPKRNDIPKRNGIPKRLPFHSWGGKRANQVGTEKIQASRVPFNAWGGKRSFPGSASGSASASDRPDEEEEEKETARSVCCTWLAIYRSHLEPYVRRLGDKFPWDVRYTQM